MNWVADDTSPEAASVLRAVVMSRSGAERVRMATGMWATARRVVEAGLRAEGITDETQLRTRVFHRMYASDFDAATLNRISLWLEHGPSRSRKKTG